MFTHQRVPLVPMRFPWLYGIALAALGPMVLVAGLVNGVPLLGGYLAGRILPDDTNVIALWRILVGFPLFVAWVLALGLLAVLFYEGLMQALESSYRVTTTLEISWLWPYLAIPVGAALMLLHMLCLALRDLVGHARAMSQPQPADAQLLG